MDQPFAVGVQEAEVACAAEAFGEDVLQDQTQERHAADGFALDLFGLAVLAACLASR
jgi:hypothetical protein